VCRQAAIRDAAFGGDVAHAGRRQLDRHVVVASSGVIQQQNRGDLLIAVAAM